MSRLAWLRGYRQFSYLVQRHLLWRRRARPSRMYRNGRPVDPILSANERLFLRCKLAWMDADRIKPAIIHVPDQSVHRQRYSLPIDVLLAHGSARAQEWLLWGVAVFRVADLPPDAHTSGGVRYHFTAEHDPVEDN